MNYFVEGIQGSGKSTLVQRLENKYSQYRTYKEGEYTPIELAWCAYVDSDTYEEILKKFPGMEEVIKQNTTREDGHLVITYTKIRTDNFQFYQELEKYEIYNGNRNKEEFEQIILSRYEKWKGENGIFECVIFQNIIENMMLYLELDEEEILDFYRRLHNVLQGKEYKILYLEVEQIKETIEVIKKERCDENGEEKWFQLMVDYIEQSPYGKKHNYLGLQGLVAHLERRIRLEKRLIQEIFWEKTEVMKSKKYQWS